MKLKESEEVKNNPKAHQEFLRVKKLLSGIDKSDDLYGSVINRYCLTLAECADFEEKREHAHKNEAAFKGYHRDSYIISTSVPRFGTGEAKGVIKESVRGLIFI